MSQPIQLNKRTVAYLALNAFALFIIYELSEFITPFLGSLIFYVLFRPFMEYLVEKRKWKDSSAALLVILISFIIVLVPVFVLSNMLYSKVAAIVSNPAPLIASVQQLSERFYALTGKELVSPEMIGNLQTSAGQLIPSFIGKIFVVVGNIGMMYFMLYYMLVFRKRMQDEVNNYLPFNKDNIGVLAAELESQTISNSVGVPLIAIIQGTAAGLGYWLFGVQEPVFWGTITAFASVIPLAGSTLVWAPAALILMLTEGVWMGLGLAAYGGVVIINIDNVARFMIQKKFADVHPLITLFGVIIGLQLFGLPGLIFGPLMLSYFVIFVKMYRNNYHKTDATAQE